MTNPFLQVPPADQDIYPRYDHTINKWQLVSDGTVFYTFKSEKHFRKFSLEVHVLEHPVGGD